MRYREHLIFYQPGLGDNAKNIVYAIYMFQQGDAYSSATNLSLEVIDASKAILDEDVFIDMQTCRLDTTIQFVTLGYNMIRVLRSSLDFFARYLEAGATDVDLIYEGLIIRASYSIALIFRR